MSKNRPQPQKYFFYALAIALSLFLYPVHASSQGLSIAAIVNDDVISVYDLEERVKLLIITSNQRDSVQLRKRLSRQILNRLIVEQLITHYQLNRNSLYPLIYQQHRHVMPFPSAFRHHL